MVVNLMNKGYILILLALFFLVPVVHAADFSITIEPVKDQIYITESALFKLTITNEGKTTDTYKMNSDVIWDLISDPLPDYFSGMRLAPNETKSTILKFSPPTKITTGAKRLSLTVENKAEQKINLPITIYIKSTGYGPQGYIPFVMTSLIVEPTSINPNNKFTIKVKMKNGNVLNLTNLAVEVTTGTDVFYKKRITNLNPLEEKTETFVITLNPMTKPVEDTLIATVSYQDTYFKPAKELIEIIAYSELVDEIVVANELLKTRNIAEVVNQGNKRIAELYKVKTSLFESLFTYSDPSSKILKDDGQRYLVWELVLEPGEKINIEYGENYRPFVIIGLLALLSIIFYYIFRSKVSVEKIAEIMEMEEGGISKIKITLNIKNRTRKKLEHIKVIEKIPNIADLINEDYLGTLKPSKILKHDVKGMLLKWDIDELEGYEERMITYKIKSKLSIIGNMSLRPAVVKFKNPNGKITITHSNSHKLNV